MSSTKLMLLGVLIMLLGVAVNSGAAQLVTLRSVGYDVVADLAQISVTFFVVGFIVGVVGFFRA